MRVLLDSGVWYRWHAGLTLQPSLQLFLQDDSVEKWLCPLSIQEILYKWSNSPEDMVAPETWLDQALASCRVAPVSFAAGRLAGTWSWSHRDPFDRLLAAVAQTENLTLVHTDRTLRELPGFPQKYFRSPR